MKKRRATWFALMAMCFCLFSVCRLNVHADEVLRMNQNYNITLNSGESKVYTFTPSAAGVYEFWSEGDIDTVCRIYDMPDEGNQFAYNDDSGNGRNFYLNTILEANRTYYIKINCYGGAQGSFTLRTKQMTFGTLVEGTTLTGITSDVASYAFTPSKTAKYELYTTGNGDTSAYLYASMEDYQNYTYIASGRYYGSGYNARIIADLIAGHTYYLKVYNDNSSSYNLKAVPFVSGFKLSKTSLTMNLGTDPYWGGVSVIGGSYTFKITNYKGEGEPSVTSSNSAVSVSCYQDDNGDYTVSVYPSKVCTSTITVKTGNVSKTVSVKALKAAFKKNAKNIKQYSKTWDPNESAIILYKGEKTTLKTTGTSGTIKWSSTNKKVATVSSKGVVTAKGNGTATIKATFSGITIGYKVEVSYKTAVKAVRQAMKVFPAKYSQAKRMKKGYYDCSSYVWRSYKAAGKSLQSKSYAPTAASLAKWCANNKRMVYSGNVNLYKVKLLPGDLIFEGGASNGRYKGIYHVDLYQGNRTTLSVDRIKGGWYGKIYVARPCGGKVKVKNYK